MSDLTCDVAVIGAGTAGLAAEHHARKAGARTLLIDEAFAGTTCASVGCMPSKLLIAAADAAWCVGHATSFGVNAQAEIDGPAVFRRLRAERDRFVDGMKRSISQIPEEARAMAKARFIGPRELRLDDGRRVSAGAIVIATGATPSVPDAFDDVSDLVLTNRTIFELDDLPGSVAVIGAGPLGLELGQALARLGVRAAIFDRGSSLGGLKDQKVSDVLHKILRDEIDIHREVDPEVVREGDRVRVTWNGRSEVFDRILVAAGRPPNLEPLDLGAAGLRTGESGVPDVDSETMQVDDTAIFLAGDASGDRPVLHEASHEGTIAGKNAAGYPDVSRFERHVPLAICFSRPESATVGHVPGSDDQDHVTAEASFADQGRARVEARTGGLCRIYARRSDGRLVGASLCAPDAGHLAHLLAWAIEAGMDASDVLGMPLYHPTLEEGLKPAMRTLCKETGRSVDESRVGDNPCA